jgi:hypothetical protein
MMRAASPWAAPLPACVSAPSDLKSSSKRRPPCRPASARKAFQTWPPRSGLGAETGSASQALDQGERAQKAMASGWAPSPIDRQQSGSRDVARTRRICNADDERPSRDRIPSQRRAALHEQGSRAIVFLPGDDVAQRDEQRVSGTMVGRWRRGRDAARFESEQVLNNDLAAQRWAP